MTRVVLGLAIVTLAGTVTAAQSVQLQGAQGVPGGAVGVPAPFPGQPPGRPMRPPRDNQPPRTGTSTIRGQVLAAEDGQPLRRAVVRLMAAELREPRVASTDGDGRYELRDLPSGRYNLSAAKGSFVQLSYGQTRPFEPGRPVEVGDNQIVDKIDFRLPRGGVITGRVLDEFGEPISDVQVSPVRYQFMPGGRRPMPAGRVSSTNDIGEFRIFGLPPGQYFVSASTRGGFMGGGGGIAISLDNSDGRAGYAPTYYPGTTDPSAAQAIDVTAGQTVSNITLTLVPTRSARITGTVVDSQGRPIRTGMVMAMPRSVAGMAMSGGPSVGQIGPDGSFAISNVVPGDYVLRSNPGMPDPSNVAEVTMAAVTVAGADIDGIVLAPVAMGTITGRVILDGPISTPLDPTTVRLMATPLDPDMMSFSIAGMPPQLKDDFSFEVKAAPGRTVIRAMPPPASDWVLKSIKVRGEDVTDSGVEMGAGQNIEGVEVELTNRPSTVSGRVTNAKGDAVKDYSVLLFSQDKERWALSGGRHVALGRPDQDGTYRARSLPPGSYYAVALDYVDQTAWRDPDFLDSIRASATAFTLRDAEAKVLDLKMTIRQ